jgi:isocitrate dehydrogenase (NAD+)
MVARDYVGRIEFEERIVDAMSMNLVLHPDGSTSSSRQTCSATFSPTRSRDLSVVSGSRRGANIGVNGAIFEAVHGTAPDIAGKGLANPGRSCWRHACCSSTSAP